MYKTSVVHYLWHHFFVIVYGSVGFLMNYNIIDTVILRFDFFFLVTMNTSNDIHIAVEDGRDEQ